MKERLFRIAFWSCVVGWGMLVWSLSNWGSDKVLDAVTGQTVAAWVQAIGSVGAILVAIWVVQRQASHAELTTRMKDANGVRMRGGLLRSIAKLTEDVHRIVFIGQASPAQLKVKEPDHEYQMLLLTERRIRDAVAAMAEFTPSLMTCSAEVILWTLAKARAIALLEAINQTMHGSGSSKTLEDLAFMFRFQANDCDQMARWVEAGDQEALARFQYGHI